MIKKLFALNTNDISKYCLKIWSVLHIFISTVFVRSSQETMSLSPSACQRSQWLFVWVHLALPLFGQPLVEEFCCHLSVSDQSLIFTHSSPAVYWNPASTFLPLPSARLTCLSNCWSSTVFWIATWQYDMGQNGTSGSQPSKDGAGRTEDTPGSMSDLVWGSPKLPGSHHYQHCWHVCPTASSDSRLPCYNSQLALASRTSLCGPGEPGTCRWFVSRCSLVFQIQPTSFPSDRSQVAHVIPPSRLPSLYGLDSKLGQSRASWPWLSLRGKTEDSGS